MFKELLGEALPIIEKAAPALATALGGPMAGNAISLLEIVFSGSIKNPGELIKNILNDPNKETKLQKCGEDFCNWSNSISSLWNQLGRPIKLNIEWETKY